VFRLLLLLLRLLLLLLLRLRWPVVLRLWLRSCWRCDTLALRLLLTTFDLFLLSAWLLLLRLRSRLLDASCFALILATTSLLLNTRLLRWRLRLSLAIVTHLELPILRMIRGVVYTHPLREIGAERR
jgi:hypothetical protein